MAKLVDTLGLSKMATWMEERHEILATRVKNWLKVDETPAEDTKMVIDTEGEEVSFATTDDLVGIYDTVEECKSAVDGTVADLAQLRRENHYLWEMNRGVTYDFETDSEERRIKTVPTGAKLVNVNNIGGKTMIWNQLAKLTNAGSRITTTISSTTTVNGEYATTTFTASGNNGVIRCYLDSFNIITGHLYYCPYDIDGHYYNLFSVSQTVGRYDSVSGCVYADTDVTVDRINYTHSTDVSPGDTVTYHLPKIIDLTSIFGVTAHAGVTPEMKSWAAAYVASHPEKTMGTLISADVDKVISQGRNIWNEKWGNYVWRIWTSTLDGKRENNSTHIACAEHIPVEPNMQYTLDVLQQSYTVQIGFYDIDKQFLHKTTATNYQRLPFVTPYNCYYMTFYIDNPEYGLVYKNDIMISKGTKSNYIPYFSSIAEIPEAIRNLPMYGASAGTARNEIRRNGGRWEYVQNVGSVDMSNWNIYYVADHSTLGSYFYASVSFLGIKAYNNYHANKHNIVNECYTTVSRSPNVFVDSTMCADGTATQVTQIQFKDSRATDVDTFKNLINGKHLYYELAEPIITDVTELMKSTLDKIACEPGGTIELHNEAMLDMPNELEYIVKVNEAV